MAASLGSRLAGCALIVFVGVSTVRAATGRMAFSGAVVEPTCSTEGVPVGPAAQPIDSSTSARFACGRTATDSGRSYSREVTHLTAADVEHDRLLAYFASYARPGDAGATVAEVVVHTYD